MNIYKTILSCILFFIFYVPSISWGADAVSDSVSNKQDADADATAKESFQKGTELFNAGEYFKAAKQFRQAQRLRPSWKLWYNIGHAESAAKRFGRALIAFERYVAEGGDEVPEERLNEVLTEIRRLHVLVGSVAVMAQSGAKVFIDDELYGTAPLAGDVKLSAGRSHRVQVSMDGKIVFEQTIQLSGGDRIVVEAEATSEEEADVPPPLPSPPDASTAHDSAPVQELTAPPPPLTSSTSEQVFPVSSTAPPATVPSRSAKIAGWALLSTGAATAITGGVLGGMAISKAKDLSTLCTANNICESPEARTTWDDSKRLGTLSTVFLAVGGTVAVTGIITLIVAGSKSERLPQTKSRLQWGFAGSGMTIQGRF